MSIYTHLDALLARQDSRFPTASSYLAHLGVPSTSIAILDKGVISSHIITSLSDDTSTLFQACSISKPIGAAMSVFRLVAAGKLELHAPITTYLSADDLDIISKPETRELVGTITLAQLLSHTSGLETSGPFGFPGYDTKRIPTIREVLSGQSPPVNTLQIEPRAFPGQKFCYSGGGTTVVQLIVEVVTGKPFAEVAKELVFDPLGMKESTYSSPAESDLNDFLTPGRCRGNYARAYHTAGVPCESPAHVFSELGAAGLWSTPADLLKAVRAMQTSLSASSSDGESFIPPALVKEVLTVIQRNVSMGWQHASGTFGHGGNNMPGWRCTVAGSSSVDNGDGKTALGYEGLPPGCGVSVMTNSAQGDGVYRKILSAVCYLKGWKEVPLDIQDVRALPLATRNASLEDMPWREWVGKYDEGWEVLEAERKPVVKYSTSPAMSLLKAAQPDGSSLQLRVQGLEVMLDLIEVDGQKAMAVWHGPSGKSDVVKKLSGTSS